MILEHLYRALDTEYGIVVYTNDVKKFQRDFYRTRKEQPEFQELRLFVSPVNPNSEVWIVRRKDAESA